MKENGNWYDHLKPSNNAELGCYMMIILLLCGAPVLYLNIVPSAMAGGLLALSWAYWWAYTLAYRRHKQLEGISLPPSKLHLAAFLLVLSGVAGVLLIQGVSYLILPLKIFVLSSAWGLVSVTGLMLFLMRLERLADFFLKYVSKE